MKQSPHDHDAHNIEKVKASRMREYKRGGGFQMA